MYELSFFDEMRPKLEKFDYLMQREMRLREINADNL